MIKKRSSVVRAIALLLAVSAWCGSTTGASAVVRADLASGGWQNEAWQEYAAYLVSHQLCESSANSGDQHWSRHVCASILAKLAAEPGITMQRRPPHVVYYSNRNNAFVPTSFDVEASALATETSLDIPITSHRVNAVAIRDVAPDTVNLSTQRTSSAFISLRHNAIPGSLLVTILALVGIVAVARRDIVSKDNARPAKGPGLEVARITSLRRNSDAVNGHLQQ